MQNVLDNLEDLFHELDYNTYVLKDELYYDTE